MCVYKCSVDLCKENASASPMEVQWNSPSLTPPPSFITTKTPIKNPKNPFDANMTENLHLETFSPSVFSRVLSPSEDNDSNWRIEHVALLNPTDFSPNFNAQLTDPNTEAEEDKKAQEKILQFFNQKQIAPSPWSNPRNRSKPLVRSKIKTPSIDTSQVQLTSKSGTEVFFIFQLPSHITLVFSAWTQTTLSFPPILPHEVEQILNQYMNEPQVLYS